MKKITEIIVRNVIRDYIKTQNNFDIDIEARFESLLVETGYTIARTKIIFFSLVLFGIVGMVLGFILGKI